MPKLPVISGKDAIKKLELLGYEIIRQRGSHVRLLNSKKLNRQPITVPLQKELKRGLLSQILKDADITSEEFSKL